MDFDKHTVIGLLLLGLAMLFFMSPAYKELVYGPTPEVQEETTGSSETPLQGRQGQTGRLDSTGQRRSVAELRQPELTPEQRVKESVFQEFQLQETPQEERVITLDTPLFEARISSKGPSIQSWLLKEYLGPDSQAVQLIYQDKGNLFLGLPVGADTLKLNESIFGVDIQDDAVVLNDNNRTQEIKFYLSLGEGKVVEQVLRFYHDQYSFDMIVNLQNLDDIIDGVSYVVNWDGGLMPSESNVSDDMSYAQAYVKTGDELESYDVEDNAFEVNDEYSGWNINWSAVKTKYFTAAVIPLERSGSGVELSASTTRATGEEVLLKKYHIALGMPYSSKSQSDTFIIYLGPLKYSTLESYERGLEDMVRLSPAYVTWLVAPLGRVVLWSLVQLHNFIPNYGLVILIFSVLVKLLLYPLTKKSYQSMKAMQKLQPEMTALREKHKDDPQKMQTAMMQLYREHGANPMGGCLPMLLQMPLLIALFEVFRTTIELRGASFIWWITDLSKPDTVFDLGFSIPIYGSGVNVLPIIMGVTMLIQQLQTMSSDPRQKMMGYFMTGFFTLLFNTFPSGLTLYYTLFNLLTIIQQKFITQDAPDKSKKKKSKRPRVAPGKKMSRIEMMRQIRKNRK